MVTDQQERSASAPVRSHVAVWARLRWVGIALTAIALLYGGAVTFLHDDSASPIDELVYLDYAYKVWDQGVVHEGEIFGDDVAHLVACENVIPFGSLGQVCGSEKVDLKSMPNAGYTTGAGYTPVYFWTVRIIGDPIHAITGVSEVSAWRLSGVLWMAGTVLVLTALLRRCGVPNLPTFAAGLLFIASPYSWWTYTYLSTDVSVVLFGALILLVAIEAARGRWSPWWLVPLGVLAPIFKITNLLVFGVVFLFFVIDAVAGWLRRRGRPNDAEAPPRRSRGLWLAAIIAAALAGVVQVAWMKVVPLLAVSDVIVDQGISAPLTKSEVVRLATSGITGAIAHNPFVGFSGSAWVGPLFTPLSWLMIAGVVGAAMVFPWDPKRGPLVWATLFSCLAALPALGTLMWGLTNSYFALPGRYGAALIPAILLMVGFVLRNRAATAVVIAYAGMLMAFGIGLAVHIGVAY